MIATEEMLWPLLRDVDSLYYKEKILKSDEAEDIVKFIMWIIGKNLSETNIQHVIANLRSYKKDSRRWHNVEVNYMNIGHSNVEVN